MTKRFTIGSKVRLSESALDNENYSKFRYETLTVTAVSTAYMPSTEFFNRGKPAGYHPGFDASSDCALYDCEGLNCSLYDWELEPD